MTYSPANRGPAPSPAELVAYVDGRLDERRRRRVEQWLTAHPDAAAAVEEHRHVLHSVHAAAPPEPPDATWAAVLARVEAALPPAQPRTGRRRYARHAVLAGAAAAALLLVALPGDLSRFAPPGADVLPAVVPIPVAGAADVEIVSVDAADLKALVVGQPPLAGPLVLADAGDVELHHAEMGENGWVTGMQEAQGGTPMIVVPMRAEPEEKP